MLRTLTRILPGVVAIAAVAYGVALALARPAPSHPWFKWAKSQRKPLVMAHQGGEGIRPSNTMLAFDHAVSLGAQVLDTDMHITKDGVLVLMHDQTVDRTTNGTGAIRDLTLDQIKQLDAAQSFSIDGGKTFPYRSQGVTVPTLEEVFVKYPDQHYGVEIKQTTTDAARVFCDVIRKHAMQDKVLVSSFIQANMDAFRAACPEVATSATENEVRAMFLPALVGLGNLYTPPFNSLQIPEEGGGFKLLTPQFIALARSKNLDVQPWTINDEADLRRIVALGVDAINTDYPDRLIALLK